MEMINSVETAEVTKAIYELGRDCMICDQSFVISDVHDKRMICPRCKRKLRKLMEREHDE